MTADAQANQTKRRNTLETAEWRVVEYAPNIMRMSKIPIIYDIVTKEWICIGKEKEKVSSTENYWKKKKGSHSQLTSLQQMLAQD